MTENQAHAGNGPAPLSASTGGEDFTDKHVVPAVARLHNALASCEAIIAHFAQRAVDMDYNYEARTNFALAAARLASSQAHSAGAIARLADAESRQRLTNVKVDDSVFRPRRRAAANVNRATQNKAPSGGSPTRDWEEHDFDSKKSTFNSSGNSGFAGPRIRNV